MPEDRPPEARPHDAVPGDEPQPSNRPIDEIGVSEPLDLSDESDEDEVVEQQNVGSQQSLGGGEWPDPDAPPSDAAAGSAGLVPPRTGGRSQFKEAQERDRA
ncbi:MAG: hypothetical protein M3P53_11085 [Actinomycetota bacterium]|jgi:hypothetical protein|nr:hypothetical protein [Actinomycetota bacterium]